MRNKKYFIQINLAGLHRIVYVGYWGEECKRYWTKDGNIECQDKSVFAAGIVQLVFNSYKEAKAALAGAKMVADFLIERIR